LFRGRPALRSLRIGRVIGLHRPEKHTKSYIVPGLLPNNKEVLGEYNTKEAKKLQTQTHASILERPQKVPFGSPIVLGTSRGLQATYRK